MQIDIKHNKLIIPAKDLALAETRTQHLKLFYKSSSVSLYSNVWIPACAGMTEIKIAQSNTWTPACARMTRKKITQANVSIPAFARMTGKKTAQSNIWIPTCTEMTKNKTGQSKQKGFTLIEMVIAITILGIVGGISALIIGRTVDGYDALARREKLHSSARLAIDRISREVRHALPNSVCTYNGTNCNNTANRVYFLKTIDAGEYQTQTGIYPGGAARAPLPVTPNTATSFDVLSTNSLNASANDWVVVYNTNNTAIYNSTAKRKQISSIVTKDINGSAPANDIAVINFTAATSLPEQSPSKRFHIIENNATLFYLNGTDLYRATSTFASPNAPLNEQILLENVSALSFSYIAGTQQRASVLRIDLSVTVKGETIHLIHEAHIQNAA